MPAFFDFVASFSPKLGQLGTRRYVLPPTNNNAGAPVVGPSPLEQIEILGGGMVNQTPQYVNCTMLKSTVSPIYMIFFKGQKSC